MNVFNINNQQDLNNMVWMNNTNSGQFPTISSVTSGGQNPMIIDENSITYFNTQQAGQANLAQQQALMEVNQQLQGANFISEYPSTTSTISNAQLIQQQQIQLQQQQIQLQQQLNLAAYGNIVNMGSLLANNSDIGGEEDDEEEEDDTGELGDYEEENSNSDYSLQQQQLFLLQQQAHLQQQQLIEQNNIQLNDGNYFLINNPHLFNSSATSDDGSPVIIQQNPIPQQIIMTNKQVTIAPNTGNLTIAQKGNSKKLKESHKIMPVVRPGLKLKTPIAYFGNSDPSSIPIQKDGMGVCEKCGAIGVKHAFYTKERRFCSLSCARGFEEIAGDQALTTAVSTVKPARTKQQNAQQQHQTNYKFKADQIKSESSESESIVKIHSQQQPVLYQTVMPQEPVPQIIKPTNNSIIEDRHMSITRRKPPSEFANSYDWNEVINKDDFFAAPVMNFTHAPGYDLWSDIIVGLKVEVENSDFKDGDIQSNQQQIPFWIASIIKVHGYKAKLRYEGYENDEAHDFWVNLCTTEVHSVGWSAMQGRQLIPPMKIEARIKNMKKYLLKSLHHAKTLPGNFYNKLSDSFRSRFEIGLILEVVDKNCISQVKLARIMKIVGKRLYVQYFDSSDPDSGFWCHEDSPLIHPVGWATTVGHKLSAPQDYIDRMNLARERILDPNDDDATMDLFKLNFLYEEYFDSTRDDKVTAFCEGMKLEAIDPLNLSSICVATVMEVLKFGYMMIRIDSYAPDVTGSDWFCYHEKSPCIFPVGFCKANGIQLTPPHGYTTSNFNWNTYLAETKSIPAMDQVFHRFSSNHGFKVGMKVECADLMDPRLVCVATVSRVVGRLLKIHFDGWDDEYDQWLDCESPDIYPVGWCVTVGHKLEGPPNANAGKTQLMPIKIVPKVNVKKQTKKGPKRKSLLKEQQHQQQSHFVVSNAQKQYTGPVASTSMPSLPITFIKTDSDNTYTIKQVPHPQQQQQNLYGGSILKQEPSENSIINNFKNLQKNIELIEQQHVGYRTQTVQGYVEESDEDESAIAMFDGEDDDDITLSPLEWDCNDVIEFLKRSNCSQHCELFMKNKIDGKKLLQLTQTEIIQLLGMKVGPAIKVYDLIQQIKVKVAPFMHAPMK